MRSNENRIFKRTTRRQIAWVGLSLALVLFKSPAGFAATTTTINNNTQWKDAASGAPIEARAGTIFDNRLNSSNKKFFWYGLDDRKNCTPGGCDPRVINCYSSDDMVNWTKEKGFRVIEADGSTFASGGKPSVVYVGNTFYLATKQGRVYQSTAPNGEFSRVEGFPDIHKLPVPTTEPLNYTAGPYPLTDQMFYNGTTLNTESSGDGFTLYQETLGGQVFMAATTTIGSTGNYSFRTNVYAFKMNFIDGLNTLVWRDKTDGVEAPSLWVRTSPSGARTYYISVSETRGWGPSITYYRKGTENGGIKSITIGNGFDTKYWHDNHLSDTTDPANQWKALNTSNDSSKTPIKSFQTQHDIIFNMKTTGGADNFVYIGDRWEDESYWSYDTNDVSFDYHPCDVTVVVPHTGTNCTFGKTNDDAIINPSDRKLYLNSQTKINHNTHYHWVKLIFDTDGTPKFDVTNDTSWTPNLN